MIENGFKNDMFKSGSTFYSCAVKGTVKRRFD